MQNRLIKSLIYLSSYFLLINTSFAGTKCSGYDITFTNITVTGITNSSVYYNFEINNIGTQTMTFDKLVIQNYLSNGVSTDAAGGSILAFTGSTQILAGATFSSQFQANYSGTFDYTNLIVQLSYSDGECDATNNQLIICLKPDASFTSVAISNVQSATIDYDFTIKNTGGDTLFFDELTLENYLSTDNAFGGDVAAGSTLLTFHGEDYLLANQSYTTTYSAGGAIASYAYLITKITYTGNSECTLANNEVVELIPPIAGVQGSSTISGNNSIVWNFDKKSFTINQWGSQTSIGILDYKLYNTSGILQKEGSANIGESTMIGAMPGIYLLVVSDGHRLYSKKIQY
jgi:hypothetical protein